MKETLKRTKEKIQKDPRHWLIHLMDFVDDFRYYKDPGMVQEPFPLTNNRYDALLAATAQYICDEKGLTPPSWLFQVPACKSPWFVSGLENLKAIALVESPLAFRMRKIFVLENFLTRV